MMFNNRKVNKADIYVKFSQIYFITIISNYSNLIITMGGTNNE